MTNDLPFGFPTTHWTQIALAGGSDAAAAEALAITLARYAPAMRAHLVHRKGLRIHVAEDRVQEFLAVKFLEQNLVAKARRERGKFRTFVLTALDRFLVSEHRKATAAKRGGDHDLVPLDAASGYAAEPGDHDRAFDVEWGRQVVQRALAAMEEHCRSIGREDMWGVFEARLARPILESVAPADYEELVREFAFESPARASNVLMNAKRLFIRMLRSAIGEYTATEAEIDNELRDLMAILSDQ